MSIGNDRTLFLKGIKPAYLTGFFDEQHKKEVMEGKMKSEDYILFKKGYPFAEIQRGLICIFFHTERQKEEFLKKKVTNETIGMALGYPPSAVKAFEQKKITEKESISICYHGVMFKSSKSLAEENIRWLFNHMPVPKKWQTKMCIEKSKNGVFYSIPITSPNEVPDAIQKLKEWETKR